MIEDRPLLAKSDISERLYFIDALRVYTFLLLIAFHTGLVFCGWRWHIEAESSSPSMQHLLQFISQWRIPLLFFVSGAGISILIAMGDWLDFLENRFWRIAIPLAFSLILLVPLQLIIERCWQGFPLDILISNPQFILKGFQPLGFYSYLHLWYLVELWDMCLFLLPLLWLAHTRNWLQMSEGFKLGCFIVALLALGRIITYNIVFQHLALFVLGFCLIRFPRSFSFIAKNLPTFFISGSVVYLALWGAFWQHEYGANPISIRNANMITKGLFKVLLEANVLLWVFTFIGFAVRYLSKPSAVITIANKIILPMYIWHQFILMLLAYAFGDLPISNILKFTVFYFIVIVASYALALLMSKSRITQIFFGLKRAEKRIAKYANA